MTRALIVALLCVSVMQTIAADGPPKSAAARSAAARRAFMKQTGYPKGRPGYVIDHIIPLCAGGRDAAVNMQWEEARESYVKDKYERALCVELKRQGYVLRPLSTGHP
jgi:hypothetical protein